MFSSVHFLFAIIIIMILMNKQLHWSNLINCSPRISLPNSLNSSFVNAKLRIDRVRAARYSICSCSIDQIIHHYSLSYKSNATPDHLQTAVFEFFLFIASVNRFILHILQCFLLVLSFTHQNVTWSIKIKFVILEPRTYVIVWSSLIWCYKMVAAKVCWLLF